MVQSPMPPEIISAILSLSLHKNPCRHNILSVSHVFYQIGSRLLYSHLEFRSVRQLSLFSAAKSPLPYLPRSVELVLAGGTAEFDVFQYLGAALRRCQREVGTSPLPVELLSLCLNSHTRNQNLQSIYDALTLANPTEFIWKGPDPEHHFSTAIVPAATLFLLSAIGTWTAIQHITLTNLSFPSDGLGLHGPLTHNTPLLPALPQLRTLYLGQATLLPPSAIAAMVCLPGQDSLQQVRLVDAYGASIWGPRIRRSDIEAAAIAMAQHGTEDKYVDKVRKLVRCEAKTERIMGGDRVDGEGTTVLD